MNSFIVILILILGFILYGIWEFVSHKSNIKSIPIRIHVNGTRGKSSVTRLIGGGLRESGINTITKVTGTYPRLILENGEELEIYRKGTANIIEQLNIVKYARKRKADALIIECMAVQPALQWITEHQMINATIPVITNVRLDHVDVMGYTLDDIAKSLANTIPKNKTVFTSDEKSAQLLKKYADKLGSNVISAEISSVSDEEMNGFSYLEHKENVALALEVCKAVGVEKKIALKGMYKTIPDEGALRYFVVKENGKRITIYNAFAANDPESSMMIWNMIYPKIGKEEEKIILLNTRGDRLDRAKQLAEMIAKNLKEKTNRLILVGDFLEPVARIAENNGFSKNKIQIINKKMPAEIYTIIVNMIKNDAVIVAIGNMGGVGAPLIDYFKEKSIND